MTHGVWRIGVSIAFAACLTIPTSPVLADGSRPGSPDGRSDPHGSRPTTPPPTPSPFTRTYSPIPFNPRPVVQRPFVPPTSGGGVIVVPAPMAPSLGGLPYAYDQSTGYGPGDSYGPAESYGPSENMLMPPPPRSGPPPVAVMQYPNGRYELRGDGLTSPYAWVWIPNAPPPPPMDPPSMPPGPTGPPVATRQSPASQSSSSEDFFSFVDDQGVLHWTDRWESIPEKYRSKAKRLPL